MTAGALWGGRALAADFKFGEYKVTVPDGFEVELVAGPPMVERPISADFDEQGRLYVTDSSGSNDRPEKQLQTLPHRIVRLVDTHGDGKFDKSTVFADRMMFPEGAMWLDGALYVGAPPSIWKLTDTTGNGVVDKREEWMMGKTVTGCANDLHGPYAGLDGWIYWCKGAFAKQTYERPGKEPFVTRAAHIFRSRADGSGLEPVLTGGMDNPVGVAFTETGERILSCTFLQNPGGGKRDGLIHAIYGGVYGKIHDVIDDHPRTGEVMPVLDHLGPAAPCGLICYGSEAFGAGYEGNLFACLFNLHKVTRHVLVPEGATFKTVDSDFMTSDNPDFHPTGVVEDADGSLIVLNTGGWYKLCCPTSQLAKPDVLGCIYRVRRKRAAKTEDSRGLAIAWEGLKVEELVKLLSDVRPAVRKRAISRLAKSGEAAAEALEEVVKAANANSARARRNALWTLTQIDSASARKDVRGALGDSDVSVRHVALQSVSLWRDGEAQARLQEVLGKDSDAQNRRLAAEALGRIGDAQAIPAIFRGVSHLAPTDRVMEHALIYALIEIENPAVTAKFIDSQDERVRRAALIAVDQMRGGSISPEDVIPLLGAGRSDRDHSTAIWLMSHHAEWAGKLTGVFEASLRARGSEADFQKVEAEMGSFVQAPAVQELLARVATDLDCANGGKVAALHLMARATAVPASWPHAVEKVLRARELNGGGPGAGSRQTYLSERRALIDAALAAARSFATAKATNAEIAEALLKLGEAEDEEPAVRLEALAIVPHVETVPPNVFRFLTNSVDGAKPWDIRKNAAVVLGRARLDDGQLLSLCDALGAAGPSELPILLTAFSNCSDENIGARMAANLAKARSAASLRAEEVKPAVEKFPETVKTKIAEALAALVPDGSKQKEHIEDLLSHLPAGDIRRGQTIFNSPKTACFSCHEIGYRGGHVGPDLSAVGTIRSERDLLESIVYPSASFVRSFEPMIVRTREGDDYVGIMRKNAPDEVVLVTGPETEVHLSPAHITDVRQGSVSLMPQGFDTQLSRQELADLVAFLKNTGARAH